MPTSDYHQISEIMHLVDQLSPKRVLEIGIGFGKWGVLCRELLEIGHGQRVGKPNWKVRIDGVEIFAGYRNPLWEFAYDSVHVGDALARISQCEPDSYDLILCLDVIEHFEKADGARLLDLMLSRGKVVILSSPIGFAPQDEIFGNTHEEHKSGWGKEDFVSIPHLYKDVVHTFVAALSRDESRIHPLRLRRPLDSLGFKKGTIALGRLFFERLSLRLGI